MRNASTWLYALTSVRQQRQHARLPWLPERRPCAATGSLGGLRRRGLQEEAVVVAGHRARAGLKVQRVLGLQEGRHALPAPSARPGAVRTDI